MKYQNIEYGHFIERKNRFTALVDIDGKTEYVHVKNTGRCKELLLPGAKISLQFFGDTPKRKTAWDLIAVKKDSLGWVNIDSQASNRVTGEWLESENGLFSGITFVKPECVYGDSRIDYYLECGDRKILIEVKGCTLEVDGIGYFPDAPTSRGAKHLRELVKAVNEGYETYILYCIAMNGIEKVKPNTQNDPTYAAEYVKAMQAGVKTIYLSCETGADFIVPKEYRTD